MNIKKLSILILILLITFNGCSINQKNTKSNHTKASTEKVTSTNPDDLFKGAPDWLQNLSALKTDTRKIYYRGNGKKLAIRHSHITIPESNIILETKHIAGYCTEGIPIQKDTTKVLDTLSNSQIAIISWTPIKPLLFDRFCPVLLQTVHPVFYNRGASSEDYYTKSLHL